MMASRTNFPAGNGRWHTAAMTDLADLLGRIADRVEVDLESVVDEMVEAIVVTVPALDADPVIRAEAAASCRGNARRYVAVARLPTDPPSEEPPAEALEFARTVVRRGIESDVVYQGYRQGQQVLWRRWMTVAEEVATSRDDLAAVLNVSLDLLFRYVDGVLGRVIQEMQREREQVLGGALARRAETIRLVLDGAPLDRATASARLRVDLDRRHTALVLWRDADHADEVALETAAMAVARVAGAAAPLTLAAGSTTLWAWITGGEAPDDAAVDRALRTVDPAVRVAVGPTDRGVEGFRRSHEAAAAIHRLLRDDPAGERVSTWSALEITALAGRDRRRAEEFVASTLGRLADETPTAARLRETLRVFLDEADNAPRAAARLQTHRNTVLQRVGRATEQLGHRPGDRRLAVALALELRRRLGPPTRPGSSSGRARGA